MNKLYKPLILKVDEGHFIFLESAFQRIIVLAINPSVIIARKLCFESYNYASRRDFVTRLDIMGRLKHGNELHVLESHSNAKYWDHEFVSPTFESTIKYRINNYIESSEGIK